MYSVVRNRLPSVLDQLKTHWKLKKECEGSSSSDVCTSRWTIGSGADEECPCLVNFRVLLWFWTEYYIRRGRDRYVCCLRLMPSTLSVVLTEVPFLCFIESLVCVCFVV